MTPASDLFQDGRIRKAALTAAVLIGHAAVFGLMLAARPQPPASIPLPPIEVLLVRPEPPPEPPRAASPMTGGGAPATPSRVRPAPPPPEPVEPVLASPPETSPAPVQTLGASPTNTPSEGRGQGGRGAGTGAGVGDGSGPGSGAGRAVLISGPSQADIRRVQPRTGLAVRRVGRAEMRCRIRLDGRLEGCAVTREAPPGSRLGQAILQLAPAYRWRPPTDGQGRPLDGTEIVLGVDFQP